MRFTLIVTFLLCQVYASNAFRAMQMLPRSESGLRSSVASSLTLETTHTKNPMQLTPELLKIVNAFESIGDNELRYKQLLYMGSKLTPMEPSRAIPENKVPGCLNTVHVDCFAVDKGDGHIRIEFSGDSDGLLTKGLVSLLIRGLSGNTADDIQKIDPSFILTVCAKATLAPGRNNGFLNMLNAMKSKAKEMEAKYRASSAVGIEDVETLADLEIATSAFEGLNLVKRQEAEAKLSGSFKSKL